MILGIPAHAAALPTIDGKVSTNEWSSAYLKNIELTNGQTLKLYTIYTSTDVYFLAELQHSGSSDQIVLNPTDSNGKPIPHDYFGIEFDNNNDEVIMGTAASPDDMMIVNYDQPGGEDMFSYSYKAYSDVSNGGVNNVIGAASTKNGMIYWEMMKPLDSGDVFGHDIALHTGDTYKIMVAFWDNKLPHSAANDVNVREGNSQFITMTVGTPVSPLLGNIISGIVLVLSLSIALILTSGKFKNWFTVKFNRSTN